MSENNLPRPGDIYYVFTSNGSKVHEVLVLSDAESDPHEKLNRVAFLGYALFSMAKDLLNTKRIFNISVEPATSVLEVYGNKYLLRLI